MIVSKDGLTYELNDEIQISAFLSSGWTEVKEKPKKVKETK